jgi:hypothetical protein
MTPFFDDRMFRRPGLPPAWDIFSAFLSATSHRRASAWLRFGFRQPLPCLRACLAGGGSSGGGTLSVRLAAFSNPEDSGRIQ